MNKKTKPAKTTTATVSPVVTAAPVPAIKETVKAASASYVDTTAVKPVAAPVAAATPASTPAVAAPADKPTQKTGPVPTATATAPVVAAPARPTQKTGPVPAARNGATPVQVHIDGKSKAVIRYSGQLARTDRVVARVGLEWFGSPRWQSQQEVELRPAGDGVFEGELAVSVKDAKGADLMAVQLAFLSPTTKAWDSAGAPFGYYQVSALTGQVEPVRQ